MVTLSLVKFVNWDTKSTIYKIKVNYLCVHVKNDTSTEVKKEYTVDFTATQAMTKEVTEKMFVELTKGQDLPDVRITPKAFAEAVTSTVASAGEIDPASFADFRDVLEQLAAAFSAPPKPSEDESTG